MTSSASPYAVFKAEEWVSAVAQPIGIGQCLRLTPKKLVPIKSSVKKKSGNTWEGDSQKNIFSLRLHDMSTFQLFQRQALQNNSFVSCSSSSYSSWIPFDFTLSSLFAATSERHWLVSRGGLTLWLDQFAYQFFNAIFDQTMRSISFID